MSNFKERFSMVFTEILERVSKLTGQRLSTIENEIAEAIGTSYYLIEKWRRTKHPQMPSLDQVETVGQLLIQKGGLSGREEFERFLEAAQHPYPTQAWIRLFPTVDRPQAAQFFTGREDEIKQLLKDLQPGEVITLCGPGGIGKTSLVAEALSRLTPGNKPPPLFPDGILYHNFYGQPSTDALLEQIARVYNQEPSPTFRDAARRALLNRRALLVLDGAEEADNLRPVLDIRDRCGVLIVSRERHVGERKVIDLHVLPSEQAVDILKAWSATSERKGRFQSWSSDVEDNKRVGKAIADLLGCLPLALRLAGKYMSETKTTASECLALLKETPLSLLQEGEHQHQSVSILLQKILERASRDEREVMPVISMIGALSYQPFERHVIATGLKKSGTAIHLAISKLVRFSLIDRISGERYQVTHRLVHTYARERVSAPNEAVERVADHYRELTLAVTKSNNKNYTKLDAEREHVLAILKQCTDREIWSAAHHLAQAMNQYLRDEHRDTERIQVNELGLLAAIMLKKRNRVYNYFTNLGLLYRFRDRIADAVKCYQRALVIARETNSQNDEWSVLSDLGDIYCEVGEWQPAIDCYEQAIAICRTMTKRFFERDHKVLLSTAQTKEHKTMEQVLHEIEQLKQVIADGSNNLDQRSIECDLLASLGKVYLKAEKHQQALNYYQQSVELARTLGDRVLESSKLALMATAYATLGQTEQERDLILRALHINREIGYQTGESICLSQLAELSWKLGDTSQALEYFQQALTLAQRCGFTKYEIDLLLIMGSFHYSLGQLDQALQCLQQRVKLCRTIHDQHRESYALIKLGEFYEELDQIDQAIDCYQQAIPILEDLKSPDVDDVRNLVTKASAKKRSD